jgi:hypothetical protein
MSIDSFKQSLSEMKTTNIVKLISEVILPNLDKITDYNQAETYYRDDTVYKVDATTGKQQLLICKQDIIPGGTVFDATDWDIYNFKSVGGATFFDDVVTVAADGATYSLVLPEIFDPSKDSVTLHHSVRGRLIRGTDWTFNANIARQIDIPFPVYANEKFVYEIIK